MEDMIKANRFSLFLKKLRGLTAELLGELPSDITDEDIEEHLGLIWLDHYVKEILAETKAIADEDPLEGGGPVLLEEDEQ